jgi:hypothetical protein
MRRLGWPLASTLLALSACNALTGASDLTTCPTCEEPPELEGGAGVDARAPEASMLDGSSADGRDSATLSDAGTDATPHADAGADAGTGCRGAVACVRLAFATSASYTGDLGGIAGADAKCQALADASSLSILRGRTFRAWVSTSASAVTARMIHGTLPYVRTDGAQVASSWNDLTDNSLQNGIQYDENGGNRSGVGAWTGTTSGGATYAGTSCNDWTSGLAPNKGVTGNVGGSGNGWSGGGIDDCSTPHAIYCIEY